MPRCGRTTKTPRTTGYDEVRLWGGDPRPLSFHRSVGGEEATSGGDFQQRLSGRAARSADPGDHRSGADAAGLRRGPDRGLAGRRAAQTVRAQTRHHHHRAEARPPRDGKPLSRRSAGTQADHYVVRGLSANRAEFQSGGPRFASRPTALILYRGTTFISF